MKIEQVPYLSPRAMELRQRDQTPPWAVHPAECDSFSDWEPGSWPALDEARALRRQIEAGDDGQP